MPRAPPRAAPHGPSASPRPRRGRSPRRPRERRATASAVGRPHPQPSSSSNWGLRRPRRISLKKIPVLPGSVFTPATLAASRQGGWASAFWGGSVLPPSAPVPSPVSLHEHRPAAEAQTRRTTVAARAPPGGRSTDQADDSPRTVAARAPPGGRSTDQADDCRCASTARRPRHRPGGRRRSGARAVCPVERVEFFRSPTGGFTIRGGATHVATAKAD